RPACGLLALQPSTLTAVTTSLQSDMADPNRRDADTVVEPLTFPHQCRRPLSPLRGLGFDRRLLGNALEPPLSIEFPHRRLPNTPDSIIGEEIKEVVGGA